MGENPGSKIGGGNPLVDLWNRDYGLAIAHTDIVPRLVSFPLKAGLDEKVSLMISEEKDQVLEPGDTVTSVPSVMIVHDLDYFTPLQTYSRIMAAQGVGMKKPSPAAYETIWCSWGYGFDFSKEDILKTLPMVKKMGIDWIVIDDRWFDKYGDWNVREESFPGGEEEMKQLVREIHEQDLKAKIWWLPTAVQGTDRPPEDKPWIQWDFEISDLARQHPEWLIKDKAGLFCTDSRYLWNLCPTVKEVQDFIRKTTEKFIRDWDFDGHKLDAYYVVPPCFDPLHEHPYPGESFERLPGIIQIIYETTKEIKPEAVVEICNCGVPQDFYQSVWTDQPVTSDPINSVQVRRRVKSMKALWGKSAPVLADHIEFTDGDFASALGTGGVLSTRFTVQKGNEENLLSSEKEMTWRKYFMLYNEKMLSRADYLNLYDIAFDKPETHVICKGDTLYYAFYHQNWEGNIELRGLANGKYRIIDYEHNMVRDTIDSSAPVLACKFNDHLLIECIPLAH